MEESIKGEIQQLETLSGVIEGTDRVIDNIKEGVDATAESLKDIIGEKEEISLKLGDILRIESVADEELNDKRCYVIYIDEERVKLAMEDESERELQFKEDGSFQNESITGIVILSRSESASYAKQNGLVPGTWIDIHFDLDVPVIYTGKITNLEEDMIEIELITNDIIYLDFEYKGISETKRIERIVIREEPSKLVERDEFGEEGEEGLGDKEEIDGEEGMNKQKLRTLIVKETELIFGDEVEEFTEIYDVDDSSKRYGIEKQTQDLLNEFLSEVPNLERSREKMNQIHTLIERFKQLRNKFSHFDKLDNAGLPKKKGALYKPLVDSLMKMNKSLYWLIPVTSNVKKMYDLELDLDEDISDITKRTTEDTLLTMNQSLESYRTNDIPDGENNYRYLMNILNEYFTPYLQTGGDERNCVAKKEVESRITSVVDNFDDFNSTLLRYDKLETGKYQTQVYDIGRSVLSGNKLPSGKIETVIHKLYGGDNICLKSLLMLPMEFINLSRVDLPGTNILNRSILSNKRELYSIIFKKMALSTVVVRDLDKSIEEDERRFFQEMKEYLPDETIIAGEIEDKYEKYLNAIIPKTRTIFNLVKSEINNLSFKDVLGKLEPFLVYQDDISYKQYEAINYYVSGKIRDFKKDYAKNSREFNELSRIVGNRVGNSLLNLLNNDDIIKDTIIDSYGLNDTMSNSDILFKVNEVDNGKLFSLGITVLNKELSINDGLDLITNKRNDVIAPEDDCKKYILSKKYLNMEYLEDDNEKDIYFDKKYDFTFYDLVRDYNDTIEVGLSKMSDVTDENIEMKRESILADLLRENNGLSVQESIFEARTIMSGNRKVRDNDYCVLHIDSNRLYYVRRDKRWVNDDTITELMKDEDEDNFCNVHHKCIKVSKACMNDENAIRQFENTTIDEMIKEFDDKIKISSAEYHKKIDYLFNVAKEDIYFLKQNKFDRNIKNDLLKQKLVADEVDVLHSPYDHLRDMILGQTDFSKRQNDIVQFTINCCTDVSSKYNGTEGYDYWLYCIVTGYKLLPRFVSKLASVYIEGDNYLEEVFKICNDQGEMSDDGDAWVDKYSGYKITNIDFDTEEGYSEEGHKSISRAILEKEFGEGIVQNKDDILDEFKDENSITILNIIKTLSHFIGINIEQSHNFIIRSTLHATDKFVPNKKIYGEKLARIAKSGHKAEPYEILKDKFLIINTLCFILIAIQTTIPCINTRKTHPGCKKGTLFMNKGYPFSGTEDKSGLEYLACIAYKIRSNVKPWNSIKRMDEGTLFKNLSEIMGKILTINTEVGKLIEGKSIYLLQNGTVSIPDQYSLSNWDTFLPLIKNPTIKTVKSLAPNFKETLMRLIRSGDKEQFIRHNTIRSKIIHFSVLLQKDILSVVSKNSSILMNNLKEPFLENSCCNDGDIDAFKYFSDKEMGIVISRDEILHLSNLLDDIKLISKATILFSRENTKTPFTKLPEMYSTDVMLQTIIKYCKYDSNNVITEELRTISGDTPDYLDTNLTLQENIELMKREENHRLPELKSQFNDLLTVVNNKNRIYIDTNVPIGNNIIKLKDFIEHLENVDSHLFPRVFSEPLLSILEDEVYSTKNNIKPKINKMKDYLDEANKRMGKQIRDGLAYTLTPKKFDEIIRKLRILGLEIDPDKNNNDYISIDTNTINEDVILSKISLLKNFITNLSKVYPNMIINELDFSSIPKFKHWKLSERHWADLNDIISRYYSIFKPHYGNKFINSILEKVLRETNDIYTMSTLIEYMVSVKGTNSVFDYDMIMVLNKYLIYTLLTEYIRFSKDETAFLVSPDRVQDVDPLYSVEQINRMEQGDISRQDILEEEREDIENDTLYLITGCIEHTYQSFIQTNYSYESLKEKILRAKEKEKEVMTDFLKNMTDEEREVEKLFKKHKLEQWSVGLQKGFREYEKDTYDLEREKLEKQALRDIMTNKDMTITDMNKDIFDMELVQLEAEAAMIEFDELNLEHLGEDDDFGELDGDEFY